MKSLKYIFGLVITAVLVFLITSYWYKQDTNVQEEGTVLLEKISKVNKLVSVEGYFSEIYDYKDYWQYNIGPFQKKALIRIKAKALVGYDLESVTMVVDESARKISITQLPEPTILAIDHEMDYYDISQGTFNAFTVDDYNKIEKNAKNLIRENVEQSNLFDVARKQGASTIEMISFMVQQAGWKLEIVGTSLSMEERAFD